MAERTYPVPRAVVTAAAHADLSSLGARADDLLLGNPVPERTLRSIADFDLLPESDWATRTVASLDKSRRRAAETALIAVGFQPYDGRTYYGLLDPTNSDHGDAVVGLVEYDPLTNTTRRWEGSAWVSVPEEMEPAGFHYVVLDQEVLSDLAQALSSGSRGLLLRPTQPRAWLPSDIDAVDPTLCAAAGPANVFAIVDELDNGAVLEVFQVRNRRVEVRRGGEWKDDSTLLSRITGVDPPKVVVVDAPEVDRVLADVDTYDKENPAKAPEPKPVTAAAGTGVPASRMPAKLKKYWLSGEGALKIRWGTSGDWTRCYRNLRKHMNPHAAKGACANLHKLATGMWPGDKRNK